jgi:hypothetical protein
LRRGPGLGFDRARLLEEGTVLAILGFDGDWARVDLEGDGSIDGHVFAAFLQATDSGGADDGEEELVADEIVAALVAGAPGARTRRPTRRRSGR